MSLGCAMPQKTVALYHLQQQAVGTTACRPKSATSLTRWSVLHRQHVTAAVLPSALPPSDTAEKCG